MITTDFTLRPITRHERRTTTAALCTRLLGPNDEYWGSADGEEQRDDFERFTRTDADDVVREYAR